MEKMDFYVYLSPKEAAEKVKEAVTAGLYSGEILDEYVRILPNGKEIIMVLFEKYYMRSGNRATLTFLADNLEEHTRVHLSACKCRRERHSPHCLPRLRFSQTPDAPRKPP